MTMEVMVMSRASIGVVALLLALILTFAFPFSMAQFPAPASPPTSDGTAIDQGIAYVLMLVALAVTYLVH